MLSAEVRGKLASDQAALVAALTGRGELPAGFDSERLRATAASLARKRSRSVASVWPGLKQELDQRFDELFSAYAATVSLPRDGGSLADGRRFARWLAARGELPEAGRFQALVVDLRYVSHRHGLTARRRPALRVTWLSRSRRLAAGIWLPWLGGRWLSIPLGRPRIEAGALTENG